MSATRLPSFDLVVATVDRVTELQRLLRSLGAQSHQAFRVLLVDQNADDRVVPVLDGHRFEIVRLHARRGLSHARNAALPEIQADLVAFPDDDCSFDPQLLERIARRFRDDAALAGLTGRAVDEHGRSAPSWAQSPAVLDRANLWNRAISFTIFLRSSLVRMVGTFDEELGLGSAARWSSGEEIDYLVRAVDTGARVEYDPSLVVSHPGKRLDPPALRTIAKRDGASIGYILRKHGYPKTIVARMLVRPLAGALLALVRRDRARASFHLSTFRGRLLGYRA